MGGCFFNVIYCCIVEGIAGIYGVYVSGVCYLFQKANGFNGFFSDNYGSRAHMESYKEDFFKLEVIRMEATGHGKCELFGAKKTTPM